MLVVKIIAYIVVIGVVWFAFVADCLSPRIR